MLCWRLGKRTRSHLVTSRSILTQRTLERNDNPLTPLLAHRQHERLFASGLGGGIFGPVTPSSKARQDFAMEIYEACRSSKENAGRAISTKHGTWLVILRNAIQHTKKSDICREDWVNGLVTAIASANITWVPGAHRGRLSCTRILQLAGAVRTKQLITAPRGTVKREAMEAEMRMQLEEGQTKKARRQVIDFGCELPFKAIPRIIQDGFAQHYKTCEQEGTPAAANHYQTAHNCLVRLIGDGDARCDLMLMLALTVAASSATPKMKTKELGFEVAARKKESDRVAAALVTRMLWFLQPDAFPSDKEENGVLSMASMTKKMG